MDRQRRIEQHTWAGNSPATWRSSGRDLLLAADVLRERRDFADGGRLPSLPDAWRLHPAELMLRGMAIECFLKASWVKGGHKLAENGEFVRIPGAGSHDLVQIAGVLDLPLSEQETDVLSRLSHFIEYGGRYPVPKDADKLQLTRAPGGGRASATYWSTPSDYQVFDAFVKRVEALLDGSSA